VAPELPIPVNGGASLSFISPQWTGWRRRFKGAAANQVGGGADPGRASAWGRPRVENGIFNYLPSLGMAPLQ
jgi:hypothetical protein